MVSRRKDNSAVEYERKRIDAQRLHDTTKSVLQFASSLSHTPMGQFESLDALRHLGANLLIMPKGSWNHDALVVPVDWSLIPQPVLADLLFTSERTDVIEALKLPWRALRIEQNKDLVYQDLGGARLCVGEYIASRFERSWLVSRLFKDGLNPYQQDMAVLGLDSVPERVPRFEGSVFSLGLEYNDTVDTTSTGLEGPSRLMDVALIHQNHKVTKRFMQKAVWNTPEEAADTLWVLALRSGMEWHAEKGQHPSLCDGSLITRLLALAPDPAKPVRLRPPMIGFLSNSPRFEQDLAWLQLSGEIKGSRAAKESLKALRAKSLPLAFACLLAIHENQHDAFPKEVEELHEWCVESIKRDPALLARVEKELLTPLLVRFPEADFGERNTKKNSLYWSGLSLFNSLVPALPERAQVELTTLFFDSTIRRVNRYDGKADQMLHSFLSKAPGMRRGSLDETEALKLTKFLVKLDHFKWDALEGGVKNNKEMALVVKLFDPKIAPYVDDRLQDLAKLSKDPTRMELLSNARIIERSDSALKLFRM